MSMTGCNRSAYVVGYSSQVRDDYFMIRIPTWIIDRNGPSFVKLLHLLEKLNVFDPRELNRPHDGHQ